MSRVIIPTLALAQNNYAIQPGDLSVSFTAGDPVNGDSFLITGNEILLVQNTDSVAHNYTALGTEDHIGRTGNLVYTVPAGSLSAVEFTVLEGWVQPDGFVYLNPSDTHIRFAVLRFN